jgi:hypothetical protein
MSDYNDIITQVAYELGDAERTSLYPDDSNELMRQLLELCLCLLQLSEKCVINTSSITFPATVPLDLYDYIPIIDIHKDPNLPAIMSLLAVRTTTGVELSEGDLDTIRYLSEGAFTDTVTTPTEFYKILTNLVGVRKAPSADVTLRFTYVPYIEINNINDVWPLDDLMLPMMLKLVRCLLFARVARYELAKLELREYAERGSVSKLPAN